MVITFACDREEYREAKSHQNRSKTPPNAMETEVIHTTRKGKSILLFFPLILNYSVGSVNFPYKLL